MQKYLRFIVGLRKYLKERLEPTEALETARRLLNDRISKRDQNFLNIVERGIFNYPKSPYLKLLEPKKKSSLMTSRGW